MKKGFLSIIAAVVALSFAGVARAIPANSDMNSAIDVLENQDQGSKPAKKPAPVKKSQKHGKAQKHGNAKVKKEAPASSKPPAAQSDQSKEK